MIDAEFQFSLHDLKSSLVISSTPFCPFCFATSALLRLDIQESFIFEQAPNIFRALTISTNSSIVASYRLLSSISNNKEILISNISYNCYSDRMMVQQEFLNQNTPEVRDIEKFDRSFSY
jgi:hypothetical protein